MKIDMAQELYNLSAEVKIMRKESGFTLIELMVVIAVLVLLSAIAVPATMGWLPRYRVRAAVSDLQADMQQARLRAIRETVNVAMVFNVAGNRYTIFVDDGAGGGIANNRILDGGEVPLKQVVMLNGNVMYQAGFGFGNSWCNFDSRGLPTWPGTVSVRNTGNAFRQVRLTAVGNVRTFTSTDGAAWFDEWGNLG